MALKIYDTLAPQGDYPAVKAESVEMPDGSRLSDFKGGVTSVNGQTGDVTISVTNGKDGEDGKDGVSPSVTVTAITGGHRVTIKDASGTKTFDVMDGEDAEGASVVIVDDLETADATKALSANMGKVLSAKIENDVLTAQKAVEAQVKERVKTVNGVGPDANGNVEVAGGGSVIVDDTLSISSTNPVQNKVITQGIFQAMEMLERDVFPKLLPAVTAEDNGKFLRVSAGAWAAVAMASAEGVGF